MRNRRQLILVALLLLGALCWWYFRGKAGSAGVPSSPPTSRISSTDALNRPATELSKKANVELDKNIRVPSAIERQLTPSDKKALNEINQVFSASMSFYGKVIDQNGDPVANANVHYSAVDKYFAEGSKYEGKSDAQGLFSITNIKGAGLYVRVAKEGYYQVPHKSDGGFSNSTDEGNGLPTPDKPAIFQLRKAGNPASLIKISRGNIMLSNDGTPVEISLTNGRSVPAGAGDVRFECWANLAAEDAKQQYPWRFRISVPGGGLLIRDDFLHLKPPHLGIFRPKKFLCHRTQSGGGL